MMIVSIDSIRIYEYGMNKDLVCKKEEIKCKNIRIQNQPYRNSKFKMAAPHDMKNLKNHILSQIFKIVLNIYLKTWEKDY